MTRTISFCPNCGDFDVEVAEGRTWCCGFQVGIPVLGDAQGLHAASRRPLPGEPALGVAEHLTSVAREPAALKGGDVRSPDSVSRAATGESASLVAPTERSAA